MNIEYNRKQTLKNLEKKIFYKFKNIEILNTALRHVSVINEQIGNNHESNERMEFLGDALLGLVFSEFIYKKFKVLNEGELTKIKSKYVCEDSFAYISRHLSLGNYIILGKGEKKSGGMDRNSILADAFESLIAAIYLDSNSYLEIYNLITTKYILIFDDFINKQSRLYNYKEILQNFIQNKYKCDVRYRLDKTEGPDHEKIFYITAIYKNIPLEQGIGKNKKNAEQDSAQKSLLKLGIHYE